MGNALLLIAASREEGVDVSASVIESALNSCRTVMEKQPAQRLAALAAALQSVQPRLRQLTAVSPASSALRLLPKPVIDPNLQRATLRWLSGRLKLCLRHPKS